MYRLQLFIALIFILHFSRAGFASDSTCDSWFKNSHLKAGPGCLAACSTLSTDMLTFDCHDLCSTYCKNSAITDFIFKVSDLYPGLTSSERALAAQNPIDALKGYKDALTAENICAGKFGGSRTNDESDACRHFVWAGLMYRNIGNDLASKFLNAHEDFIGNPEDEKNMDLENNSTGLSEAKNLSDLGTFTNDDLVKKFDADLSNGKLKVLKPRITNKGRP